LIKQKDQILEEVVREILISSI